MGPTSKGGSRLVPLALSCVLFILLSPALCVAAFTVTADKSSPVSGAVVLTASGYNPTNIAGIQLVIDGLTPAGTLTPAGGVRLPPWYGYKLGPEITAGVGGGSIVMTWAASLESDGAHALAAVARYTDGSLVVSSDLVLTVSNPATYGTQYYVAATGGNDGNNGTSPSTPWATLGHAVATVVAGDTVYLKGTFSGDPASVLDLRGRSGTAARPIRWTTQPGEVQATLSGGIAGSGTMVWSTGGAVRYNILDNLHFRNPVSFDPAVRFDSFSNSVLRNSLFDQTTTSGDMWLRIQQGNDNIVDRNTFGNIGDKIGNTGEHIMLFHGANRNRLLNGTHANAGHGAIQIGRAQFGTSASNYNVIANCTINNSWGRGIGLNEVGHYSLVEYSLIQNANRDPGAVANSPQNLDLATSHNVIRFNILSNAKEAGVQLASYVFNGFSQVTSFNDVFHNVIYGSGKAAIQLDEANGLQGLNNRFYNNIFWKNLGDPNDGAHRGQVYAYLYGNSVNWATGTFGFNEFKNNVILRATGSAGEVTVEKERPSFLGGGWEVASTIAQMQLLFADFWTRNVEADPKFVNEAALNFRLQAGSPAIDKGIIIPGYPYVGAAPDIGRYEFGNAGAPPSSPTSLIVQ